MRDHTAALTQVAAALDRVAADTAELPPMRADMAKVGELPELQERILTALDGLNASVDTLQGAVGPMGRLAGRLPGQKKS